MSWTKTICDCCGKERSCQISRDPHNGDDIAQCFLCQVEAERQYYRDIKKEQEKEEDR